jgi:putative hydrolase of the HAD superfamily
MHAGAPGERAGEGGRDPGDAGAPGSSLRPAAVLFDLFHTLIDVNAAPGRGSAEILGIDPREWRRAVFDLAHHHALGAVLDPVESFRRIVHLVDPAVPEERILEAAAARPERFRHALLHVEPEILAGVGRLRALGLRIGLLSNAGHDEVEAWPDSPLAPLFDAALFSCRERLMKPDAEFYLLGARRLGVAAQDCIFAGDGGSREHEGARAAGMRTVLLLGLLERSAPEVAASRSRDADWVLRDMGELVDLVESLPPLRPGC